MYLFFLYWCLWNETDWFLHFAVVSLLFHFLNLPLTLIPRVILQSWITLSLATSCHHHWRTKEMCCLETCRRYMNFTTSRWNLLYFAIGLDIYTTITWKHWCQQRYITENCDIWTTPLLKDYQMTGNVPSLKVSFAWRNIFHLMANVHHSNSCQFVLLNDCLHSGNPVILNQKLSLKNF